MRTSFAKFAKSPIVGMMGAGVCVLLASVPAAAADQVVWEGFATNTASTSQCIGHGGTGVGDTHVTIFRPKILSTDTDTFLSFFFLRAAITLDNTNESTVPQMHGAGNYAGTQIDSRAEAVSFVGTYSLKITPPAIVATTNLVTIKGSVDSFDDIPGCTVTFEAAYVRRID